MNDSAPGNSPEDMDDGGALPRPISEILRAALSVISSPDRWTQNAWARNQRGEAIREDHDGAIKFSSLGAISLVTRRSRNEAPYEALREIVGKSISMWEEAPERTHEEVVAAFQEAIRRAEARERAA